MAREIICTITGVQPDLDTIQKLRKWCSRHFGDDCRTDIHCGVSMTIYEIGPGHQNHVLVFDFPLHYHPVPHAGTLVMLLDTCNLCSGYSVYVIQGPTREARWAAAAVPLEQTLVA